MRYAKPAPQTDQACPVDTCTHLYTTCKHSICRGRQIELQQSGKLLAGAPIAGSALAAFPAVAYVGIGYVFGRWASILFGGHYKAVVEADVPKLFIMGDNDGFTSVKQLESRVASCKGSTGVAIVRKVGHFELETDQYDSYISELIVKWLMDNQALLFPNSTNM